jgi:hypothetical protein
LPSDVDEAVGLGSADGMGLAAGGTYRVPHRLLDVRGDAFDEPGACEHGTFVGVVLGPPAVGEEGVAVEPGRGLQQYPGLLGAVVAGVGVVADALEVVGDVDEGAEDDSFRQSPARSASWQRRRRSSCAAASALAPVAGWARCSAMPR